MRASVTERAHAHECLGAIRAIDPQLGEVEVVRSGAGSYLGVALPGGVVLTVSDEGGANLPEAVEVGRYMVAVLGASEDAATVVERAHYPAALVSFDGLGRALGVLALAYLTGSEDGGPARAVETFGRFAMNRVWEL